MNGMRMLRSSAPRSLARTAARLAARRTRSLLAHATVPSCESSSQVCVARRRAKSGTCMLVDATQHLLGTIGGGQLEWAAIEAARRAVGRERRSATASRPLVLGTQLAQCCGGVVEVWIERYTRADLPLLATLSTRATRTEQAVSA